MIALNPIFLWMLPLAALPVLFHLFLRVRKRTRSFSTLMFFLRADPRLSARKRIREWLALILRTLAILFLLFALSRPVWMGAGGTGARSQALVIDNSASMSAPGKDGRPRLTLALEAAGALIADMDARDTAALGLLVADPSCALPRQVTSDKSLLRTALNGVRETEAEGMPASALEDAFALLDAHPTTRPEIHVFTDLQDNEWGRAAADVRMPPFGAAVTIHRIGAAAPRGGDVAITGVELPRLRMLAGRRGVAWVSLTNPTDLDAAVRFNAVDDEGNRSMQPVSVSAREGKRLPVVIRSREPGQHWINAWIENDSFEQDNRACVAFTAGSREEVAFVGPPDGFGMLPLALSPRGDGSMSGLTLSFGPGEAVEHPSQPRPPAMLVAPWPWVAAKGAGARQAALRAYVEKGGILLIVPVDDTLPSAADVPGWTGATPEIPMTSDEGFPVIVFDKDSALWDDLRDREGNVELRGVKAFRLQSLRLADDARAVLGLANGKVLLSERALGEGRVFACGMAFDTRWSNLPLKQGFLAMVQTMALLHPKPFGRIVSRVAGEPALLPVAAGAPVQVRAVTADRTDWQGMARDFRTFARSGVYEVKEGDSTTWVSARSCDREGAMRFVAGDQAPALQGVAHRVLSYEEPSTLVRQVRRDRTGIDLFLPLVLLAVLSVMAEGWVVNPVPRGGRK